MGAGPGRLAGPRQTKRGQLKSAYSLPSVTRRGRRGDQTGTKMQTSGGGGGVNDEFGPYAVPERAERFASSAPACSWPGGGGLARAAQRPPAHPCPPTTGPPAPEPTTISAASTGCTRTARPDHPCLAAGRLQV